MRANISFFPLICGIRFVPCTFHVSQAQISYPGSQPLFILATVRPHGNASWFSVMSRNRPVRLLQPADRPPTARRGRSVVAGAPRAAVCAATMAAICRSHVDGDEPAHPFGKICLGSLNNRAIMVGHQASGLAPAVETAAQLAEQSEPLGVVSIVEIDRLTPIAARDYAKEPTGELRA